MDSPTSAGQIGPTGTFGLMPAAWLGKIPLDHRFLCANRIRPQILVAEQRSITKC